MKRALLGSMLVLVGCTAQAPEAPGPGPPVFAPLEDVAVAKQLAAAQKKPLLVLSVLGDYKKHC